MENLPYCDTCPVAELLCKDPLLRLAGSEAIAHAANYIDEVVESRDGLVEFAVEVTSESSDQSYAEDIKETLAEQVQTIAEAAEESKRKIKEYIDLLPAGTSDTELLALGQCASQLVDGRCSHTGGNPGYKIIT